MSIHRLVAVGALSLITLLSTAQAVTLPADSSWSGFSVDANLPPYSAAWIDDNGAVLNFDFNIAAGFVGALTVLDTGFSGDVFQVRDGTSVLGSTGAAVAGDPNGAVTFDPSDALADSRFSRGFFTLDAGAHHISGSATQFLADANGPLNATIGAVRLTVSPVPEPASLALLLAGLSLLSVVLRRGNSK
jgi:hypothetical protein